MRRPARSATGHPRAARARLHRPWPPASRYKRQFEAVRDATHATCAHELDSFWLRKTRKAVISVVMTNQGDTPVFYRGMNMEVSMPTGTLCAERNAIGNALAANQTLRRQDIHAVAVLSLLLDPTSEDVATAAGPDLPSEVALNPLAPCGACMEWLKKIAEVNPDFKVITFSDTNCEHAYIAPIDVLS